MAIEKVALVAISVMWSLAFVGAVLMAAGVIAGIAMLKTAGAVTILAAVVFGVIMAIKEMADDQ